MNEPNPYATPQAPLVAADKVDLAEVARARRTILVTLALFVAIAFAYDQLGRFGAYLWMIVLSVAFFGLSRLVRALRMSTGAAVLMFVGLLVPLANLLVLSVMAAHASNVLRAGGYEVGLFGARKP